MYRLLLTLFIGAFLILACGPQRGVQYDIEDQHTVAVINDWRVPTDSARALQTGMNRGQVQHHLRDVVQGIIENELIAEYALDRYGMEELVKQNRVAFEFDVIIEDQSTAILRHHFEDAMLQSIAQELPEGSLAGTTTQAFTLKGEELLDIAELQHLGKIALTQEQQQRAKETVLIAFQFPGAEEQRVTLWDIYRRMNIQGKDRIHKGDVGFVEDHARQRVGSAYVRYWLKQNRAHGEAIIAAVERFVRNKELKQRYMQKVGLIAVLHANTSEVFKHRAEQVPQAEIAAYFKEHKADFERVERARGRHLRFADESTANKAYAALHEGASYDSVAEHYQDKLLAQGDTGWIERRDREQMWLQTLLFTQPLDTPSRPFRSPQSEGEDIYWDIVIVDQRETGYPAVDSESVRYEVSQILAKAAISKDFKLLRDTLFKNALVRLNPTLLELDEQGDPLPGTESTHKKRQPFSATLQHGDHAGHSH
ncbi:putative peptidyl-prolyl isomerase [gamma proteobacterium HTCC5015]|nr:putative peptidyl-prolyl isomerase [gamma proteobacterium HTCC5015]